MQHLFSVFLVLMSCNAAFAYEADKAINPFYVQSSKRDKTLKKNEAVFELHILNTELRGEQAPQIWSSCNGTPHNFTPDANGGHELRVKPGTYAFQFYAPYFQEIYSDSVEIEPGYRTIIVVHFIAAPLIEADKPVIYLYPPADLEITATVDPIGEFTFTYPAYENGWSGTAHPDGSTTINGKTYPYLFWEARSYFEPTMVEPHTGFIVPQANTTAFLEEKLTEMGLSSREQTDFITYWGPKMTGSEQYFVQFLFNDACNRFAELQITPQPEQLFRVYMLWSPVTTPVEAFPQPQVMQRVNRTHFYAIEWGGSEIPFVPTLLSNN